VAFYLFSTLALLLVLGLVFLPRWAAHRRLRVVQHPFPAAWRKVLQRRVPLVRRLPVDLQLQLKKHIQVFIAEKAFIGCAGLRITDEMRVVIAAQADDGRNVVIHEFARQLDQESGPANGAPLHAPGALDYSRQRWSQVFHASYAQLQHQARTGSVGLLDPYGAQDPAEFFAVASEVFFERPKELALEYPELYRELSGIYRVAPASW